MMMQRATIPSFLSFVINYLTGARFILRAASIFEKTKNIYNETANVRL